MLKAYRCRYRLPEAPCPNPASCVCAWPGHRSTSWRSWWIVLSGRAFWYSPGLFSVGHRRICTFPVGMTETMGMWRESGISVRDAPWNRSCRIRTSAFEWHPSSRSLLQSIPLGPPSYQIRSTRFRSWRSCVGMCYMIFLLRYYTKLIKPPSRQTSYRTARGYLSIATEIIVTNH